MAEENGSDKLVDTAKAIGSAIGKAANALGVGESEAPAKGSRTKGAKKAKPQPEPKPQPEDIYKSEYIGSGTFIIKKPRRSKTKIHQSRTKSPQRGARK